MNKKLIIPGLALSVLIGVGSLAVSTVYAQENTSIPSRVQEIAERFNLDKNEVEDFFEEKRTERMTERENSKEEALDTAVAEGKLTKEQKEAFLAKMEECRADREGDRTEMQEWADENGIDLSTLNLGRRGSGEHFMGKGESRGRFGRTINE